MERLVKRADRVTVSNSFLQKRFGGTIIYHFRDTDFLNPERFDSDAIKQKLNINSSTRIIMFFGTPRPHKGLEDLIKAVSFIKDKKYKAIYCWS